jgi:hypothetical protein
MDMSTPSTAQNLDGAVDASLVRATTSIRDISKGDALGEPNVADPVEATNEVPMQFVRLGLPAAILLWFVIGLVAFGAYRFLAG